MADNSADVAAEGEKSQDVATGEAQAQDPKQGDTTHEPEPTEDTSQEADEGKVNRHQYERDIERRDKRIKELEAQVKESNDSKAAKGDETAKLRQELDDFKGQLADERLNVALTAAGCIDAKAAKACLDDFDGDVSKLKDAKPYLFGKTEKKHLSTGGNQAGSATTEARSIKEGLASRD
jgi:chromosome condensin MukBEF ATPase and DNA-binding subunit MukB